MMSDDIWGISLSRVSSKEQLLNHSLEAQDANIDNVATEMNVKIARGWTGNRSSRKGMNYRRKDLEEMLKYCKSKDTPKISYLFIDKVDRLMRELEMLYFYKVRFKTIGVQFIFCDPSQHRLNAGDGMSQLMLAFEAQGAEDDNARRSGTTTTRMKRRTEQGYYLSYPHMCYKKSEVAGLHIPDDNFPIVQQGSRMIIHNGISPSEAVRWMNDNGFRSKRGERLDLNNYIESIKSDYYRGKITIKKSKDWPQNVDGLHVPMFTPNEHLKLCEILSKRNPRVRRKHNPDFPLSNRLQHDVCIYMHYSGRVAGFYHNKGRRADGSKKIRPVYQCRDCKKYFLRKTVQASFEGTLGSLKMKNQTAYIKTLKRVWNTHNRLLVNELASLKTQRSQLLKEEEQLAIAYATSDQTLKDSMRSALESVAARRKELDARIQKGKNGDEGLGEFIKFAIEKAENMRSTWGSLSFEDKKRCEQILFPDDFFVNDSAIVHTPKISDIYRLGNEKDDPKIVNSIKLVELQGIAPWSIRLSIQHLQA